MFHRVLDWYRGLSSGWKWVAWLVVALVAVVSVLVFAIPWLTNARLRDKVRHLQAGAAVSKAKYDIAAAKKKVEALEGIRDDALASEAKAAIEEQELDNQIEGIDRELAQKQGKVKEQTDEEQAGFFNDRFGE